MTGTEAKKKINFNGIPEELKQYKNWVLWKFIDKKDGKKPTKVPFKTWYSNDLTQKSKPMGYMATSTNPEHWDTFENIKKAYETGKYEGIGFVFGNTPYCGIDIDHCIDETGIKPKAYELIQKLNSWTELSPSKTGIHTIIKAEKKVDNAKNPQWDITNNTISGLEIYDTGRYFTMTGLRIGDTPETIEDRQKELDEICDIHFEKKEKAPKETKVKQSLTLSESEIIEKAMKATNGSEFKRLYDGDISGYGNDHSSADLALCNMLAFYTQNFHTIDSIFKSSGLYREKWDRQDYKSKTINEALSSVTGTYDPKFNDGKAKQKSYKAKAIEEGYVNLNGINYINPLVDPQRYQWNDIGNGNLFADNFKGTSRYVKEHKEWACYNKKVWILEGGDLQVSAQAKKLVMSMFKGAFCIEDDKVREGYISFVNSLNKRKNRETMLNDARDVFPISIKDFDKNKFLLNCQNGVLNLKTFEFTSHDPELLLSKIANVSYNPLSKCERWEKFIDEIMENDKEKAKFLQKALGYAITGDTSIECFFILYGATARNGKGTTMDTMHHLLGDYAKTAQPETLAQKSNAKGNEASEDIASIESVYTPFANGMSFLFSRGKKNIAAGNRKSGSI
jgi:putative DNA primase/helicase